MVNDMIGREEFSADGLRDLKALRHSLAKRTGNDLTLAETCELAVFVALADAASFINDDVIAVIRSRPTVHPLASRVPW